MSFAQMKESIVLMEDESGSSPLLLDPHWDWFMSECVLYMSFLFWDATFACFFLVVSLK